MRSPSLWLPCLSLIALGYCAAPAAAQWGTFEGRVVFEGEIPHLPVKVMKGDATARDKEVCAVEEIPDYRLTIDPETRGVADVFVYLRKADKVHPDLAGVPTEELVVDQKHCRFIPHTLVVRCKQQVIAKSQDPVPHNIHGYNVFNTGFNLTIGANDRTGQKLPIAQANTRPEPLPIPVKCDIHTHMESYWLIVDHPYAAVTDKEGKFKIEGLPVGEHSFTVYHSTSGFVRAEIKSKPEIPPLMVKVTEKGATEEIKLKAQSTDGKFEKLVAAQ